jgi:hypothetical protein
VGAFFAELKRRHIYRVGAAYVVVAWVLTQVVDVLSQVFVWHPSYAPVRKTQQFKSYVRYWGVVDYWRARGWPDLCRPVGADDFVCD